MLLEPGEKLHVIHRRRFDGDVRRHFAGQVVRSTEHAVRLEGYVFVFDANRNEFVRRQDRRSRIVSLTDASNLLNVLPQQVRIEDLVYRQADGRRLVVTDGRSFQMDIQEFGTR